MKKNRIPLLVLILLAISLYFPLNRLLTDGTSMRTPLDAWVPIVPVFAIPYVLFLPYWLCFFLYATWKMDDRHFRGFVASALFAILTANAIFFFFPTYVERPVLTGDLPGEWMLRLLYSNDRAFNAFPSEHVLYTTVIACAATRWKPRLRGWMIASVVLVVLATLLTGQHHLPDPLGGLALAWVSCRFGAWVERRAGGTASAS